MKRMNQFVYALLIGCVLLTGCGSNTNTTETKEEVISDSQANASTEATQSESTSEEENDSGCKRQCPRRRHKQLHNYGRLLYRGIISPLFPEKGTIYPLYRYIVPFYTHIGCIPRAFNHL